MKLEKAEEKRREKIEKLEYKKSKLELEKKILTNKQLIMLVLMFI
jgi:hypothetical protein